MTSPHSFHERADPVSDTVGLNLPHPALRTPHPALRTPRSVLRVPPVAPRAYALCPLAVSLDSMVKIAS
jgi:hypothetical protein